LIDYLTPEEYFYYIGSLYQISRTDVDLKLEAYKEFFNDEILGRKKYIRDLSKGNQSKVGVVACLIQQPEIILLDEPFANIDPSTQIRLKNILKQIEKIPHYYLRLQPGKAGKKKNLNVAIRLDLSS